MSRRSLLCLHLLVVGILVAQSCFPALVPAARAQGGVPDRPAPTFGPGRWPDMAPEFIQPQAPAVAPIEPAAPEPPVTSHLPQGPQVAVLAPGNASARFGDLPVSLDATGLSSSLPIEATVNVLPPEAAGRLSSTGVAFQLRWTGAGVHTSARLRAALRLVIDYRDLGLPRYGASFEERLTLLRGVGCVPTSWANVEASDCRAFVPVATQNDAVAQRLTASLDDATLLRQLRAAPKTLPAESDQTEAKSPKEPTPVVTAAPTPAGETAADLLQAELQAGAAAVGGTVYVLAAGASSDQGDYSATPYDSSSDYQLSLAVGSMQTSYEVPLPPAAGGLEPDVTLQYDSGSVDGMTINKNNQPGWIGIGWHYEPGSIIRRLKTCGLTQAPGDLCLTGDNYVLQLNGISAPMVKDASGLYHPQNDPRWKVEKLTNGGTGHPDTNKEYWQVTTPDGVKYRFGGEFDPEKTAPNNDQNSAFYTTVYDQTCSSVSSYWVCNRAWKWNLDRIEDPNGNVISFYYQQETNFYNARNGLFRREYVRAGNVARIEYGRRAGSVTVPTQVVFNTVNRCETANCVWPTDFPDTPGDLSCTATGTCSQNKPTFWSKLRLDSITPQIWDTSINDWRTVSRHVLSQIYVKPPNDQNGAKNEPKLWLNAITQQSGDGVASLPPLRFDYELKQNRRDNGSACTPTYCSGNSSLTMPRIDEITDPLGGVTSFTYGQSHQCPIVSSGFTRFPYDCFVAWNPAVSGFSIFNKWKIMSVTASDSFSGNPPQETTYTYSTPINHYDDDPVTPSAQKSWGDFRGSAVVTETDASGAQTEHRFFRGMNGDYSSSGATYITLSDGSTRADENWLRGREVETRRLKADGTPLTRSVNWPTWTLTAGSGTSGAYFVGTQAAEETTYGTVNKTTRTERTYDAYGNVLRAVLKGDTSTNTDDRYLEYGYSYNTTAYIVDTPQWQKLFAGTGEPVCSTYTSTDVPKAIPASGTSTVNSVLSVPDSGTVTDVNVLGLNGTHTYINDLVFTLIGPSAAQTILMNRTCGSQDNFNINFDDESANAAGTWPCPPTNGGTYRPTGSLTALDGSQMQGTWTLRVQDMYTNDGGSLNGWQLQICRTPPAGEALAFTEYAYDGQAVGAAPLKGNPTLERQYHQLTPAVAYYDTTTVYDAYGRSTSVTDANGHASLTSYHPFYGYVETETNGIGHITSYVRDPGWGDETSVTDPNGRVTTLQYDAFGRLTKVWQPSEPTSGPPSEEFVYDIEARPASILDRELVEVSSGAYLESWTYYDGFVREIQTQRPGTVAGQRVVTSQQYDADGELAYESSAYEISGAAGSGYMVPDWQTLANYQYTQYDELARPTRIETRSGASTLWVERTSYDGWLQSAFDANDHRTDSYLNAFGKTWRVVEYNDGATYTTDYAFDARDNLVSVTDALSHTITLSHDMLGRKTGMTDPDMGAWQYSYDGGDNLTAQRDGRGQWLYFEYDAADRLVRKRQDAVDGPVLAEWLYDAPGQLSLLSKTVAYTTEGAVEVRNLAYDIRNRNTEKEWVIPGQGGGVFRFAYGFNEADQQTWVRYPGGNTGQPGELVAKHYNGARQLDQVASDDGTQYVASTLYNAQGQIIEQRLDAAPNGLTRQYVYDPGTLRLSVLRAGVTSPFEELQKLNFSYDNVGNVTSITDGNNSDQKQCFRYDALDRLTFAFTGTADCVAYSNVGSGAYSHTYAYDAIGNITSYNGSAYTYGSQPHAVTAAFGNSYGYDASGNQIGRTVGGVSYALDFDYENRLAAVRQGETVAGSFLYDADGDRVKGTVNGVTTVYLDGIYEYQGGATTKYYDGGAIRRSGYPGDNGIAYNLTDHLQSTSVLVNRDGTLNGRNLFFPYGGNRGAALNPLTTKRFTGQYHEPSLPGGEGLYFFNARWYDAQLGRFLSADPLVPEPGRPQALNRYAYTLNNPLKYTDPTGHFWWIAAAGAVGAVIGAGSVALPQMIQNVRTHQPLTANISAAAVGKAAAAGFVAGAVGAATFGAGTAVMGGGFAATVGAGMISGVTAGQAGRAADNVVNRRAITSGLGNARDMGRDALIGGLTAGTLAHAGRTMQGLTQRTGSRAPTGAVARNTGQTRPAGTHSHPIVARRDVRAGPARDALAKDGIGINDAANIVTLRANTRSPRVLSLWRAPVHSKIHTSKYYQEINRRFRLTPPGGSAHTLRTIRRMIIWGRFPY